MQLEIYSDLICPWCFIGKKRLERALESFDHSFEIVWKPFILNAGMPEEGMERRQYRLKKFGSLEYSNELDAQVIEAGKTCNIDFNFNDRTPNTKAGHLLVQFARNKCNQNDLMESIFQAYFCLNKDIGNLETLTQIGSLHGLPKDQLLDYIGNIESHEQLQAEIDKAKSLNISSVPSVVIGSKLAFSGAYNPSAIKDILSGFALAH
ncbi:MAG: DsbA family oxidoreductase [Candidatus Melainabacteria bacterium]|nr:DsbA family oxidoreductase [Candidatus Melainabacteria bacterium]